MLPLLQAAAGVVLIPLAIWFFSERRFDVSDVATARGALAVIAVQFAIALALLSVPQAGLVFDALTAIVLALQAATEQGAQLLFGYLAGGPAPFTPSDPGKTYLLAFRALPLILVLSAIVRVLYYWGVLQRVVAAVATLMRHTTGAGGPLATASAASIFLGTVEAPLLVRPYLATMGRGALFATMVVVMSTVAGTVMALYASVLSQSVPGAAGHLLAASIMNVPGALLLARLSVPEGFAGGPTQAEIALDDPPRSTMDAIAQGTFDGIRLVVTVAAMLIVMVALVSLVNACLSLVPSPVDRPLSLEVIFGALFTPLAMLIGIPYAEAPAAGALLGQKLILNEFLAYLDFARLMSAEPDALSDRSRLIMTYALCGFANLGSMGILIGGLSALVPERRDEVVALAPRAVAVGFFATLLSAAIIGCVSSVG